MSLRLVREKVEFLMFFFGYGLFFFTQKKKKKKNTKLKGCTQLEGDIVDLWLF
jgi:hypothetical protein